MLRTWLVLIPLWGAAAAAGEDEAAAEAPPLWMEAYGEGGYSRHEDDNTAGYTDFKLGKRVQAGLPVDFYARARMFRDERAFYWNNRADAGAGIRVHLLRKVSLTAVAEVLGGSYLRTSAGVLSLGNMQARFDRNRMALEAAQGEFQEAYRQVFLLDPDLGMDSANYRKQWKTLDSVALRALQSLSRLDFQIDSLEGMRDSLSQTMDSLALVPAGPLWEVRAGLIYWQGWGAGGGGGGLSFPLRSWGELYGECLYSGLRRTVQSRGPDGAYRDSTAAFDNLVVYLNPHLGWVLMEGGGGSVTGYAAAYAWLDTRGDWWNNRAMAGPGLRYQPLSSLDLVLSADILWGAYYGRERPEDPNPYETAFQDVRLGATFWYGIGI